MLWRVSAAGRGRMVRSIFDCVAAACCRLLLNSPADGQASRLTMTFQKDIHVFRAIAIMFIVGGHCRLVLNWDENRELGYFLADFLANGTVLFVFIARPFDRGNACATGAGPCTPATCGPVDREAPGRSDGIVSVEPTSPPKGPQGPL